MKILNEKFFLTLVLIRDMSKGKSFKLNAALHNTAVMQQIRKKQFL